MTIVTPIVFLVILLALRSSPCFELHEFCCRFEVSRSASVSLVGTVAATISFPLADGSQ